MRSVIKKWGNSASRCILSSVMEAARLKIDDSVEIREEAGRIVIDPIRKPEYDLSRMIIEITPENIHSEVTVSATIGKELL